MLSLQSCNIMLLLFCNIVLNTAKPIPIIIDTDIGTDFDDSWALTLAISSPDKWDVRMVLTATFNTPGRAQIVAKYLTRYNRTDIPIGIGIKTSDRVGNLYPWAEDFDLAAYNTTTGGKVHADGVRAARDLIMSSSELITFIAIAPMTNFGSLVQKYPEVIPKVQIYAMFGAVDLCYGLRPINPPGSCHEYNVAEDRIASQQLVAQAWPMTITPLDTCDYTMHGAPWERMQGANNSDHVLVSTLLETLNIWGGGRYPPGVSETDIIYDAVAVYMLYTTAQFNMEKLTLSVTDQGATIRNSTGKPMNVALTWKDSGLDNFLKDVADMIIAAK